MKINSLYTSLALVGVASAAAVNKEARLQKRALEIVTVTDVVWDVVTVTQYDEQSTSTVVVTQAAAAAGTPLAVTSTTTPAAAAAAVQATSTSASAVIAEAVQAIKSTTSSEAATTVAVVPTTTAVVAGNVVPAAVTTSTTPVAAAAATTSPVISSTSASSYSGEATFYELGLTACGQTYVDTDYVAAISYKLFDQGGAANPNNNPHCGKKIAVLRNGKTVDVTIVDRCAGCEGEYDVDLSPVAFNTIASASEGRVGITWTYV